MIARKPKVYIALETKARELEGKTLLSGILAKYGFEVILGHKGTLDRVLEYLPPGLYFDKSSAGTKLDKFKKLKAAGHRIAVHDEEGLVYHNSHSYVTRRVSREVLSLVDLFFAWGKEQSDAITSFAPESKDKVFVVGNPRFDLLRGDIRRIYEEEVAPLRSAYGPYILINTRFGTSNNVKGVEQYLESVRKSGRITTNEDYAEFKGFVDFVGSLFPHFVNMINVLSESFPDRRIVVRPHPSEDMRTWNECLSRCRENVNVIREKGVYPWILGSDVVIHNGCMTAVEARLLDVPAIAYRPVKSVAHDLYLPNSVSLQAETVQDVCRLASSIINDTERPESLTGNQESILNHHAMSDVNSLSAERIAEKIVQTQKLDKETSFQCLRSLYGKSIFNGRVRWLKMKGHQLGNQKFPGLSALEVAEFLKRLGLVNERFRKIRVNGFTANCVTIAGDNRSAF